MAELSTKRHSPEVEGYVFNTFGPQKYLRHAVVAASTLRRYDQKRPIAIYCTEEHRDVLQRFGLDERFAVIGTLPPENRSIIGFKHALHRFMPFDRNLYLDADIICCRNPDRLWHQFYPYPYTITGQESADVFFGASKHVGIIKDILLRRRQRTLRRFGLSHLYRVQTGINYVADYETACRVNDYAAYYYGQKSRTHFVSRTNEQGRTLDSCEWSLGMAMSKLNLFVYPWFNGYESPQLDFIQGMTDYDPDFHRVRCLYYCNPFIYSLRGLASSRARSLLLNLFSVLPRSRDHLWVTPYFLHFGWHHQKAPFECFAKRQWHKLVSAGPETVPVPIQDLLP